ncbi:MAG: HlyD family efflux transporter periplasmic adaptor subunit [Myxococcales bacterium]
MSACTREPVISEGAFQGVVELDVITLSFEVPGRVERVNVAEGQALQGATVLAELDETMARAEREARAADLEAAKAQLELLEAGARSEDIKAIEVELNSVRDQEVVLARQRQRQEQLTRSGAAASASLDDLDTRASTLAGRRDVLEQRLRGMRAGARRQELEAARAKVKALEAALLAADVRLGRFKLGYEGSAEVLENHVKGGEYVNAGAPAFTIADLDHPYVDIFVPQAHIASIHVGMPMSVRVDSLARAVAGKVERVGRQTEFTPRFLFSEKERVNLVIRVRVRVEDRKHELKAGVPAFVKMGEAS